MIKQINGEHIVNDYTAPASVEFALNDVVTRNSSGTLALAVATTPRSELLGLIQIEIASTDDDYASAKTVPVLEFHDGAEYEATVDTGTPATTNVGSYFDLADENGIDVTSNLEKVFRCARYISSTILRGKMITSAEGKFRLVSYQETVTYDQFTDGGSAIGTYALGTTIPAGAIFAQSMITAITGFAGDTSATITIGTSGGDVDRYNTGTPSVFTTAVAGVAAGAASGTTWHTAAVVPDLLVTTDADFTSVTAGSVTITLFWYEAA